MTVRAGNCPGKNQRSEAQVHAGLLSPSCLDNRVADAKMLATALPRRMLKPVPGSSDNGWVVWHTAHTRGGSQCWVEKSFFYSGHLHGDCLSPAPVAPWWQISSSPARPAAAPAGISANPATFLPLPQSFCEPLRNGTPTAEKFGKNCFFLTTFPSV